MPESANRPVVESIDLVDALEAAFFNHKFSTWNRTLLWGLEEETKGPVAGESLKFVHEKSDKPNEAGHMSIVTAHMGCSFVFGNILKICIEFLHLEGVDVCSECHASGFSWRVALPWKVYNESCGVLSFLVDFSDRVLGDSKGEEHVFESFVGFKLFEGDLRILMKFSTEGDKFV